MAEAWAASSVVPSRVCDTDLATWLHDTLNSQNQPAPVYCRHFGRHDLAAALGLFGYRRGAEIGVAKGEFSRVLAEAIPGISLLCVDPWRAYHGNRRGGRQSYHEENYTIATETLRGLPGVSMLRAFSVEAARTLPLESLDFVYIDANHDFDFVMEDLIAWGRCVRVGGVIAGDDYYQFRNAGVIPAVDVYTREHHVGEWFVTNNQSRSWFFVKTW